ncbi:MAG: hypothetical protein Q4E43_05315 [Akkermansia sp.]|nr:hypothetical protein [Akkermansia sp.]
MNNIATTTVVAALLGLNLMAAETINGAPAAADNTPICTMSDKGISCGDSVWVNVDSVTWEAANGNPIAQYTVAYMLDNGISMPQDSEKAAEMYGKALPGLQKAAADGHAGACRALCQMYTDGKGVDKDPEMAAKYKSMWSDCCKGGKRADGKDASRPDGEDGRTGNGTAM